MTGHRAPPQGRFRALGATFCFEVEDPALAVHLSDVWSHTSEPGDAEHRYVLARSQGHDHDWVVTCDGANLCAANDGSDALAYLLWHVNRTVIDGTHDHVIVHAAGALAASGAVVLAAPMDAGKTTTVAGLVGAGLGYLTDEAIAVVPHDGTVRSFPKPLSVDPGSFGVLAHARPQGLDRWTSKKWHVGPTSLHPDAVAPPGPHVVAAVVFPKYVVGAQTEIAPVHPADAVLLLIENCFDLMALGDIGFRGLVHMVREVPCHRLTIGNLDDAVRLVLEVVGASNGR